MRRLMPIAAFVLFLALPLWGQHGGGHTGRGNGGGFAGHGSFGGGHMGGGRASGGMHSSPGASRGFNHSPSFSQRGVSRGGFSRNGFRRNDNFRGRRFRRGNRVRFGFRNNCFTFGCRGYGYPWAYGGYFDPYWWWDSGSSYDEDYQRDREIANQMNQESLDEQRMRWQEENDSDPDVYSRSSSPNREQATASSVPPTVLVFRDHHKKEVQNYAIVGQTLWNFSGGHTEKIPLSDLDLTATTKANDDRGLTFRVPDTGEAQ